jgi:hypothetical protein
VVPAACWAHVRRKFYEIAEAHGSPLAQVAAFEKLGKDPLEQVQGIWHQYQ